MPNAAQSTGLGPIVYVPVGSTGGPFTLYFTRADTGSAIDLTGATEIALVVKRSLALADADGEVWLMVGAGITVIDAVAGIASATISSALTATLLRSEAYFYFVRAVLASGEVVIPDLLRGRLYTGLDAALNQAVNGDDLVRVSPPSGTLLATAPDMANYILNRYDLTGLYGGTSAKLDGLSLATLAALANGARIQVGFAGRIVAQYKIRANAGGEVDTPVSGQIVLFDNNPLRVAELEYVWQGAMPCTWDEIAKLWCPVTGYQGNVSLLAGFTIPA